MFKRLSFHGDDPWVPSRAQGLESAAETHRRDGARWPDHGEVPMFVAPLEDKPAGAGGVARLAGGGGDAAAWWPIRSGDDGDLGDPKTRPFERCLPGAEVVEEDRLPEGVTDDRLLSTSALDHSRGVAQSSFPNFGSVSGCEHDTHRQEASAAQRGAEASGTGGAEAASEPGEDRHHRSDQSR